VAPRITAAIDNTARVQIPHSTHPLARPAFDNGRLEGGTPMKRMILILGGSPAQDYQLSVLLDSQQSKGSPDYHHWLTPDQFGEKFGPAPQDIQTVTGWLLQQGFGIDRVSPSGKFIQFTGTSAQVEAAFQTQMHRYQVNGEAHIANATDISIPAALAPVIRGVASLNNFFPKPASHFGGARVRRSTDGRYEVIAPDANLQTQQGTLLHALAPGDFAAIYDLNPLYTAAPTALNGTGVTIAIVALSDINLQDIADFRTVFGLPANTPNIIVDGEDPGDVPGGDEEATIDTEWSGSVAPGATIDVVISANTLVSPAAELSPQFIVDQNLAQVINVSLSACEAGLGGANSFDNDFFNLLWQQAAAQGMSVFVSTGDTGAAGCDPNEPVPAPGAVDGLAVSGIASTPYDTAVGGSEFNETGAGDSVPPNPPTTDATFWSATNSATLESALGYIPEMVWNESCTGCEDGDDSLGSGGGGLSTLYPVPSWQTLSITGLTGAGFANRALPDVSLASAGGHDGYIECFQASCEPTADPSFFVNGGTSFAAPAFAGIMAIVDQKLGAPQGLANYTLYSLASAENFGNCNSNTRVNPATAAPAACVFNDVTVGNNGVPGNDVTNKPANGDLGYPAGTGYDLATGLGSVDAKNLVNAWANAGAGFQGSQTSITSPGSINITHGQSVTLNVHVQKAGGGSGPTGNVGLITDQAIAGIPGTSTIEGLILSGGTASTGSIDFLPGGSYHIFANYAGDGTFAGSKSAPISVTVAKEASCVELGGLTPGAASFSNSLTNVAYGTPLAFDLLVTGAANTCAGDGIATGTITSITNAGTSSGTLTSGALSLNAGGGTEFFDCDPIDTPATTNCFTPGTYTVDANYSGDNSFNPGNTNTSNPVQTVSVMIVKATTTTTISPSSTILARNGSVTLTATVGTQSTGLAPTGAASVQFLNNGVVIATVPLVTTPRWPRFRYWPLVAGALVLFLAYALSRPRTRRVYAYSGLAILALMAFALAGCGGGGGGGGGGHGGAVQIGAVSQVSASNGNASAPASLVVQTTLTTTFKSGTVLSITANYAGDTNYSATAVGSRTPVTITVQ
jgi:Pro-kumamolisin, activation domain/Bacterial Ig-like domain (group 3)